MQEAWLRLDRAGDDGIENFGGWLTTVVSRICLDHLRIRSSRGEEPVESGMADLSDDEPRAAEGAGCAPPAYERASNPQREIVAAFFAAAGKDVSKP